jgi:hypothetical protein
MLDKAWDLKQPILRGTHDSDKTHYDDWPQQCRDAILEVLQALKRCLVLRVLPSQLTSSPKRVVMTKRIKTTNQIP